MPTLEEILAQEPEELNFTELDNKYLPEMRAIPDRDVRQLNLLVTDAMAKALGSLPQLRALRAQIVDELPRFDLARFDKLEDYTKILFEAQGRYVAACKGTEDLESLYEVALQRRTMLIHAVTSLADAGLLNPRAFDNLVRRKGYANVAADLALLTTALRQNWEKVRGRCALEMAELDQTESISVHILRLVGRRTHSRDDIKARLEERERAFTLFINCYEDAQRAAQYLRYFHGDAHKYAPNLYAGHKHKAQATEEPAEAASVGPEAPTKAQQQA
jgi:hypothetical protein